MGYESRFTGRITITPPLSWAEIRAPRHPGLQDVRLVLDERTVDTDTGQVRTVTAVAVEPITAGTYNGYAIEEELQALVDAHKAHTFAGAIQADGPEGNHWRYRVDGRRVLREEPHLAWPGEGGRREQMAAALVLPTDSIDADTWSIVTNRAQLIAAFRALLGDIAPDLLHDLEHSKSDVGEYDHVPNTVDEFVDHLKEQQR